MGEGKNLVSLLVMATVMLCVQAFGCDAAPDIQRPVFHVMPPQNWMNDPNGPMYYKGYYHLFYQYNPGAAVWGDMHWGHAISSDLAFWHTLPIALSPDTAYDSKGVFSGSITMDEEGNPVIIYTGQTDIEVQCLAYPKNLSDPMLVEWEKPSINPVILAPSGVNPSDFRDDTTAWQVDGVWYMLVGSSLDDQGAALLFQSKDLKNWEYLKPLWNNSQLGPMWECPDFYPVPTTGLYYVPYVLKVSENEGEGPFRDYWTIGFYDERTQTFHDQTTTQLWDQGTYYASKSFFDPVKKRQIVWGWINEDDDQGPKRGWQGVQSFPREVRIDAELLIALANPIEEIELLRTYPGYEYEANLNGTTFNLKDVSSDQLEIIAKFHMDMEEEDYLFGVRVRESSDGTNYTSIYYQSSTGVWVDRTHSGTDGSTTVQGGQLQLKASENTIELHILVDHSLLEVFAQGGRTVITSRVYPGEDSLGVSLFSEQGSVRASCVVFNIQSCWV